MNKKTALGILIVVIILAILFIGFFLFFKDKEQQGENVFDSARNFFGGFFPSDGDFNPLNNLPVDGIENSTTEDGIIPRLRQISNFPVAGAVMFEKNSTSSSLLAQDTENPVVEIETFYRFVERSTGHIYETTSKTLSQKRITNTTLPKIQKAYFSLNGEEVILSYLNNGFIESLLGKIIYPEVAEDGEQNFGTVQGSFVPSEYFGFVKSNFSNDFAFLNTIDNGGLDYTTGVYVGNFKKLETNKKVYDLEVSEWNIQMLKNGTLALSTKSAYLKQGFLYFLNPTTGSFVKKLGNTFALNSLVSPDGERIIYSYNDSGLTKSVLYNSDTGLYTTLDLRTLPQEKCVWSQNNIDVYCAIPTDFINGNFPDVWYQGKYQFNDGLVKINTDDFSMENLMPANSETIINLDVIDLQISPSEEYLMFVNKNDLYLWSLDII